MSESFETIVIGGGPAGLATSRELTQAGVEHVVLERGRVGETWRGLWDSFCLATPNWTVQLPGHGYDGEDPDGFMPRDEMVAYLERYAASVEAPVREGVEVTALEQAPDGGFVLRIASGDELRAPSVVVSTGAYQRPHRPPRAGTLPDDLPQLDARDYRNPDALPDGGVLIVGGGQSGCQIAEELVDADRKVFLSSGRAPWMPRRFGSHDVMWWADESGFLDQTTADLTSPSARLFADLVVSGRRRGHDLNLRTLLEQGATLLGRFVEAYDGEARFAPDLLESVDWGDTRYRELRQLIWQLADERELRRPDLEEPSFFPRDAPTSLDLAELGSVVFASGFRPEYASWVQVSGAFDPLGFPRQVDGASTAAPGLYFVGVHFLRTRKSALLSGVGEDAAVVAGQIAAARA